MWCEGRAFNWDWHWGDSFHVSVIQFSRGTWDTVSRATGLTDPENLYHVGANVAYWSRVVDPASSGGWEDCW